MRVAAHGISVAVPDGWDARIFRRSDAGPVMHLASFPLLASDGDFGAAATGRMRPGDAFTALLEYRDSADIRPGVGLFSPVGLPVPSGGLEFSPQHLQVTRGGQLGWQRFFTDHGRTCCLYAVLMPRFAEREPMARELAKVIRTIKLQPAG